ncbi:hypothetical protein Moror_10913 [Moniliophthora roreri MCA 2997]|uniref:Uncharacterized protein n=1 Tax=Moniliophthora roreri (strain MCA 2997) TaxID=1381753 RepID=V2X3I0_MONRO|nr:hypothetical protein Moror_10913 [Moniliophthora roreri MCA 2997]
MLQSVRRLATIITTQYLLYGIYAVLFGICIRILSKRKVGRYRLHCLLMTLLFGLATASLVVATLIILGETNLALAESAQAAEVDLGSAGPPIADHSGSLSRFDILSKLVLARTSLFVCSNVVADTILIWRCYLLWGRQKKIIVVPVLLCIATNTFSIISLTRASLNISAGVFADDRANSRQYCDYAAFLLGTLVTNLLLTSLLGARILYFSREAMKYAERDVNKLYSTVLATTLESGLLYPIALVFASSVVFREMPWLTIISESTALAVAQNSLHQVVGIAPTLVIVRTSLGIDVENRQSLISTFRAQDGYDGPGVSSCGVIDISRPAAHRGRESRAPTSPVDVEAQAS